MTSLRSRLLLWLLTALVLAAGAGGALAYRNALDEANGFFDEELAQTAQSLRHQTFEYAVSPEVREAQAEYDFVVQVFSGDGVRVYLSHPHAVLPGLTTLGLSTVDTPEGKWRLFGVQARGYVIQVAQPMEIRARRAGAFALRTLVPLLLAVPLLGLAVWLAVGRALAPLNRLEAAVRARAPADLAPLPETGLPSEIQPLVASLNALLLRLGTVLQRERAFIADAAHELRSPLTALRLQAQALEGAGADERPAALGQLVAGVGRASRLVEQLLSLARQEPGAQGDRARVDLSALARDAVTDLLPLADSRNIDIGLAEAQPVIVDGDAAALQALLRNLLDNAVRYTPGGGRVDVTVTGSPGPPRLTVTDTGPGIPVAERQRVFDRFYRRPGTGGIGSGLGLAIVRAVAGAHGARIELGDGDCGQGLKVAVEFASAAP